MCFSAYKVIVIDNIVAVAKENRILNSLSVNAVVVHIILYSHTIVLF